MQTFDKDLVSKANSMVESHKVTAQQPLELALQALAEGRAQIDDLLETLERRLLPICRDDAPAPEDSRRGERDGGESLVVHTILSEEAALQRQADRIRRLMSRLEV